MRDGDLRFEALEPFGFAVDLPSLALSAAKVAELRRHFQRDGLLVVRGLKLGFAVQHARGETGGGVRTLQRVTVTDFTYEQQYPTDMRAIYEGLHNEALLEAQEQEPAL